MLYATSSDSGLAASHPNKDVWVVVRCFNEATVVGDVVGGLRRYFPNVVGVDDGSSDNSADVMRKAGAYVVRHPVNLGAGAALQTGLEYSLRDTNAKFFICFDADGQHRVSDAVALLDRARRDGLEVVIGSRFLGTSTSMPRGRARVLKAARRFERISSGAALTDAHNGLRVFHRDFACKVKLSLFDMAYASELVRLVAESGARYGEHPVTIDYTDYSLRKGQRSINAVNIAVDMFVHRFLREQRS